MHVDLNRAAAESEPSTQRKLRRGAVIKSKNVFPQKCYFLNKHEERDWAQVAIQKPSDTLIECTPKNKNDPLTHQTYF